MSRLGPKEPHPAAHAAGAAPGFDPTDADLLGDIVRARVAGEVTAQRVDAAFAAPEDAARRFGLSAAPGTYVEITPDRAVEVLTTALHEDLAYGVEIVPLDRAAALARRVVAAHTDVGTRFYTNGTLGTKSPSWTPATDATFDIGVLVLTPTISVVLWFQDED